MVRGKSFSVLLFQALLSFSFLVAALPISHLKSPLKSMNHPPAPFPGILTWQSWLVSLIWWFEIKHPCSIVTSIKQLIGPSKAFNTLINHLEAYLLSLKEISSRYCLSLSKALVSARIQMSQLWHSVKVLKLTENIWLNTHVEAERNFAKWQLEIGHGQHTDEVGNTKLPDHFKCTENTVSSFISAVYPGFNELPHPPDHYFTKCTILTSRMWMISIRRCF